MAYSENFNGYIAAKAQDAKGTQASGADAFIIPTSGGAGGLLSKAAVESQIVRHDAQQLRGRHGSRRTSGSYTSELGIGRHDAIWAALMRNSWGSADLQITEATGAMSSATLAVAANTITASGGSWITAGLRVGDVFRLSAGFVAGNMSRNLRITGLTATVITVAETLTVEAGPLATYTVDRPGRVLINGAAGALTRTYFTIEEHEYDLDSSELFTDCRWSRGMISMQPDGMLNTEFGWTGTGQAEVVESGSAPHFSAPTEPTALSLAALEASVRFGSEDVADLTSLDITFDLQPVAPPVAASQYSPDVFLGIFLASMNMTFLRKDLQALADFDNETQLSLHLLGSENETAPADFFSLFVPNFTLGGVAKSALSKQGGARTATLSVPSALIGKDERGGAFDPTTVKVQVSNAS